MWKWWWEAFWGLFKQLRPVLGILLGSLGCWMHTVSKGCGKAMMLSPTVGVQGCWGPGAASLGVQEWGAQLLHLPPASWKILWKRHLNACGVPSQLTPGPLQVQFLPWFCVLLVRGAVTQPVPGAVPAFPADLGIPVAAEAGGAAPAALGGGRDLPPRRRPPLPPLPVQRRPHHHQEEEVRLWGGPCLSLENSQGVKPQLG